MVKRIVIGLAAVVAGLGVGAGGAWAAWRFLPQYVSGGHAQPTKGATEFVPPFQVLAPLVATDGRLTGYTSFELQLEVPQGESDTIGAKLPLLMDAVNKRTYRTPMASGPDGMLPGLDAFRRVVMDAAAEVYGKDVVRSVAVTRASPG